MARTKVKNIGLNNSSITINGSAVSLGGSVTVGETKPTVANVAQTIATATATTINITGTNFVAIPQVQFVKSDTGAITIANTVSLTNATTLSVNVTLASGNYFVRIENPDGNAGRSSNNIITASTAPSFSTNAGSLGTVAGDFSGAVATVAASSDSAVTYSETTNVLENASQANCTLNPSTGAITTTDFGGSSTTSQLYNFTLRATDQEAQTVDRAFSLTSSYSYSADFLVIAGGGRGGNVIGGGGGAGGFKYLTSQTLNAGTTYTITVGAGQTSAGSPNKGGNSSLAGSSMTTLTAIGGGEGGDHGAGADGFDGGSGGGAGANGSDGTTKPGGSATSGQGFDGGTSNNDNYGAGGGGASAVGSNGGPGNGGAGLSNSITGSAVTYAGGGGGGHRSSSGSAGSGGSGGGGNGTAMGSVGQAGTANLGGGGGAPNGSGGTGVVILSVPSAKYSGTTTGSPTISVSGSQRIIKFTQSGTYTA